MPRYDKHTIQGRNQDIALAYKLLSEVKEFGAQKYSHEFITAILSDVFYLSNDYIEHLLRNTDAPNGFNSKINGKSITDIINRQTKTVRTQGKLF